MGMMGSWVIIEGFRIVVRGTGRSGQLQDVIGW